MTVRSRLLHIGFAPDTAYSPEIIRDQVDRLIVVIRNDRWCPIGSMHNGLHLTERGFKVRRADWSHHEGV
jgi:hypothetical protein